MSKPSFYNDLSIPIIAAPLFLISGPKLVIECCKNGIIGTFPALNHRTTEGFEQWVIQIKEELSNFEKETGKKAAPFGVNLIVHNTNPRIRADLKICVKHKVPIVITSLGAVSQLVGAVHSYGGLVYHDIIKKRHAEKASEAGVDGLILVSAGAGGLQWAQSAAAWMYPGCGIAGRHGRGSCCQCGRPKTSAATDGEASCKSRAACVEATYVLLLHS